MAESVILNTPVLLVGYGIALFLCLFDLRYQATRGLFPIASCAVSLLVSAWALLQGAGIWEVVTALLGFLALHLPAFQRPPEDAK